MLRAVSGNQEALRRYLIGLAAPGGKTIVIVPEQYTLQTERELMEGLRVKGFFDLEVLSPSRLTERVFALAGADGRERIDQRGKQFALARAMMLCKKKLRYYESATEKQGFIERIGALIAECKQAGISPEALADHANSLPDGASKDKYLDLALVYAVYARQLEGQFVDGEDVADCMLLRLADSGIIHNARVAVYGFDSLTGQMIRLLVSAAQLADQVEALVIMGQEDMFSPVRQSVVRLWKAAEEANVPFESFTLPLCEAGRAKELTHLSLQYLRSSPAPYPGIPAAIRQYAAPSPYFEAHFAAQEMALLHENGMAFGDMTVAMGDPQFAGTLSTVLASYRIPCYIARKMPAVTQGASRFLLASLRAVAEGYAVEEMLVVIKSGYAPITEEEAWQLENYIQSYGIQGKLWLNPFKRGSAQECAALENARSSLITPLHALRETMKEAQDSAEALRAVYDYLDGTAVYDKLLKSQEALMARDMPAEAMQLHQFWEALTQLLSQAHALLGSVRVSPRQLASWLEAGLEACELSSLPPTAGAVICGTLGNLPLSRPKALFLMNMTDGMLGSRSPGLLTSQEQEDAQNAMHAYLSIDEEGQDALAQLDVWKTISAPTDRLYLTRSLATQDGGTLRPFPRLAHIRAIFPGLVEEGSVSQRFAAGLPLAPAPAFDALGVKMKDGPLTGPWLEAWKYLSAAPETRGQAQALLDSFSPPYDAPPLPREVAHSLFMERVMSVSRLESFAVCPYKHFVEQGLSPKPRKEWALTPIDAGNFYHGALEGFTRLLPTIPHWPKIDKKTCDGVVDKAAEPLFQELLSGVMGESSRMRALGEKYRRVLRRVAWTFTKGAKQSAFTPEGAEIRFGYPGGIPAIELPLKDGTRVFVRGVIDRIDRYAGDEGLYLRVVDYKSGTEKLSPAKIFWGAQLQLLLYLKAALTQEEGAEPAGAFYMRVADPLLATEEETEQIEEELARALCLRGVALKDVAILKLMDEGNPPLTLPKVLTAKEDFDKRAMLATLEDMKALIGYAGQMARKWAERIYDGEIAAAPLCDKRRNGACDHCDYADICRRDLSRGIDNARMMQEMKFDELLEKINRA